MAEDKPAEVPAGATGGATGGEVWLNQYEYSSLYYILLVLYQYREQYQWCGLGWVIIVNNLSNGLFMLHVGT